MLSTIGPQRAKIDIVSFEFGSEDVDDLAHFDTSEDDKLESDVGNDLLGGRGRGVLSGSANGDQFVLV